ncbi:MAG: MBL fold metallo-hydrolase [Bryobacteraceae bacterium]|jgi:glyoxylase-like metal-dependent hydrolase (beta-lactamase superfamily II)
MRIVILENSGQVYTSQVYLVLGSASRLEDVNTLVDVGQDPGVLASIARAPTGVGKWPVEQVVITHGHYDHCALLPAIRETFHPRVLAFSPGVGDVDRLLRDGDAIKMGDQYFEVIHTPGHSSDSICLYNRTEGVLFAGDTPLLIGSPDGTYEAAFLTALAKLCARDIQRIYFGHGPPLMEKCNERLRESQKMAGGGQAVLPPPFGDMIQERDEK